MADRFAVIEPRGDGTTLIRSGTTELNHVLSQFAWAVFVTGGIAIPTAKAVIASAALTAAGFQLGGPGSPTAAVVGYNPEPLPECRSCGQPYPRDWKRAATELCANCHDVLRLDQHRPNDRDCPHCRFGGNREFEPPPAGYLNWRSVALEVMTRRHALADAAAAPVTAEDEPTQEDTA